MSNGIILLGYGDYELYRAKLEQLVEQGTHFVRWGFAQEGQPGTTIGCDTYRGGIDAARHLMQHGRGKIAFLGDASSHYPEFQDRYRGSCEAQGGEGIVANPALQIDALNSQEAAYEAANILIASGERFDAIFAASDTIAIGAMKALREHGIDIPGDVAIVGFDDIPAASLTHPPLTTIQQNYKLAGEVLVDGVLKQIRNEAVPTAVLPAKLIVRQSCGSH